MRLSQLSESTALAGLADGTNNDPGTFTPKVPEMPPVSISLAGTFKMLAGLDPTKAAGPDTIKPIVLRSLTVDQVAKPTFRSRYAHTPFVTEQSEGPMDTVASTLRDQVASMLQVIFQKSLDSGHIPFWLGKGKYCAFVQKGWQVSPCKLSPNLTDMHLL